MAIYFSFPSMEELLRIFIKNNYFVVSIMFLSCILLYFIYKIGKINIPGHRKKLKTSIAMMKKETGNYTEINYKNLPKDVLVSGQVSKQSDTLETRLGKKAVAYKEAIKKRKRISTHADAYQESDNNKKNTSFILKNSKKKPIHINSNSNFDIKGEKTIIKTIRLNDDNPESVMFKEQGYYKKRSDEQIYNYIEEDKGIKKEEEGIIGYTPNSIYIEQIIKPKDNVHIYGELVRRNGRFYIRESNRDNKLIIYRNYSVTKNIKNIIASSLILLVYISFSIILIFTIISCLILLFLNLV